LRVRASSRSPILYAFVAPREDHLLDPCRGSGFGSSQDTTVHAELAEHAEPLKRLREFRGFCVDRRHSGFGSGSGATQLRSGGSVMIDRPSRRTVLKYGAAAAVSAAVARVPEGQDQSRSMQRTVVIMFDGFGVDYLAQSRMPVLEQWKRDGLYKPVKGLMPSVTNINNASICCGVWPEE